MRGTRPLIMAAFVSLFLAEGQRAFFASLFVLGSEALLPTLDPLPAAVAVGSLLFLLAPLLPLARWLDRRGAVALGALGAAIFRVPMTHPALEARLVGGALVLASCAIFLTWAVGYLDRRALGGGVVVGLVVDQLLRFAGSSFDLSLRSGWLPVQTALSLALIILVMAWARESPGEESEAEFREERGEPGLERRAGGLRLRGAVALGALLFIDLHVLGLPPVVARWTGVGYETAGLAVGLGGAAALAGALLLRRPTRGRTMTFVLVALVTAGALLGHGADGAAVMVVMAIGHSAALLLVTRALDPASGRRSGSRTVAGFGVLAAATLLYGLTFYPTLPVPATGDLVPWIFGGVGVLLAACFILLPRPPSIPRPRTAVPTVLLIAAVASTVVALGVTVGRARPGGHEPMALPEPADRDQVPRVRVARWSVRYGFDEDRRFDPATLAETLRRSGAEVAALREVAAGTPIVYGVDLPLWIGRRTGLRDHFSATTNGLLGDAFLVRDRGARVEAAALPADPSTGAREQLLRLTLPVGDRRVTFYALRLAAPEPARGPQMDAVLEAVGPGPAVVLGDLNPETGAAVATLLAGAGFREVLTESGVGSAASPDRQATGRTDRLWVRGVAADSAAVLPVPGSEHGLMVATLHILPGRIRSTNQNDLQKP